MFFWDVSFSLPGRLLGAKGAQKAPKMEPKWRPKGARGDFLGSEKTMVFTVWEPHGDLPGRVQKPLFFKSALRRGSHRHLEEDLGGLFEIWVSFGGPWGTHFQTKIMFFFRV